MFGVSYNSKSITNLIYQNSDNLDVDNLDLLKSYSKIILDNSSSLDNVSIIDLKKFTKLIFNISKIDNSLKTYYPLVTDLNELGSYKSKLLFDFTKYKSYKNLESHFLSHASYMKQNSYIHLDQNLNYLMDALKLVDKSKEISFDLGDYNYYSYRFIQESDIFNLLYKKTKNDIYILKSNNSLENSMEIFDKLNNTEMYFNCLYLKSKNSYILLSNSNFSDVKLARECINSYSKLIDYYSQNNISDENLLYFYLNLASSYNSIANFGGSLKYAKKSIKFYNFFFDLYLKSSDLGNTEIFNKAKTNFNHLKNKFFR